MVTDSCSIYIVDFVEMMLSCVHLKTHTKKDAHGTVQRAQKNQSQNYLAYLAKCHPEDQHLLATT